MKRTTITRRARLRPINAARRAKAYARNFGPRADAIRSMPCLVPGCPHPSQAAHSRARGMGGCGGDRRELVPLCAVHHAEAGEARTSQRAAFELEHGLSLTTLAAELAERFDEDGLP